MGRVNTLTLTAGSDVIEGFTWSYDRNGNPHSRLRASDTRDQYCDAKLSVG